MLSKKLIKAAAGNAAPTEYQISRSLRFNSADSAYLNRTPASAGNRKTWTWSGWVKRSGLSAQQMLFNCDNGTTDATFGYIALMGGDTLRVGAFNLIWRETTQVFRDPSSWLHLVVSFDTTQATGANRVKVYVNGVQVTSFSSSTDPTQNADYAINQAAVHNIGKNYGGYGYFSGYLAEVHFVDGQALTPSDFGETDATTGVWKPKAYAGTYGTNGFYLDFSDNSSTTALGYDAAGSNDWTPNNFSVTAGAGNDSLVDTPTGYGVDTGAGGEVRGNYATLNPLAKGTNVTLSNGSLDYTAPNSAGAYGSALSTIAMSSGKWYAEYVWTSGSTNSHVGIATGNINLNTWLANNATGYSYYANGTKWNNGSSTAYGASYTNGDVIGVAFDADAGTLTFYKNNVSQGTAFTGLTNGPYFFGIGMGESGQTATINFGQRPFAYTAPSGFKALCTQNLPDPTVVQGDDYFNTVLYTGNGSTQSITGVGFQPDWVWVKQRSGTRYHSLYDAVRGADLLLKSNTTDAEANASGTGLTSFDSDGFSIGSDWGLNENTYTYVGWNWNAGGSNATNTDGTITSTVRANPTAGFSVVSYTGNGTVDLASATIGHGLGVAPKMIITKNRSGAANTWNTYHASIGNTGAVQLESTAATDTNQRYWNNTSPTTSVFTVSTNSTGYTNANGVNYIAYCFAEVEGFSKFGSYTGNGSTDGAFVYCGFRPAFVMIKVTSTTGAWHLFDSARNTYNVWGYLLAANISDAEYDLPPRLDALSNGFKLRGTTASNNASGQTYIFMAFAENPFKYSLAQ